MKQVCLAFFVLIIYLNTHGQVATGHTQISNDTAHIGLSACTEILQFDNYNDNTAGGSGGQNFVFVLQNGDSLNFNLHRSNATLVATVPPVTGNSSFGNFSYTGFTGKSVLYENQFGAKCTLTFSNIRVTDSSGMQIPAYRIIVFDGEGTGTDGIGGRPEHIVLNSTSNHAWYNWDSIIPPFPYYSQTIGGLNTDSLVITGNNYTYNYHYLSHAMFIDTPQTFSVFIDGAGNGLQGVAIGIERCVKAKNDTVCSGQIFNIKTFNAAAGTTYTWSLPSIYPAGSIIGASGQLTGVDSIVQRLISNGSALATATYSITPTSCGKPSQPFTAIIYVTNGAAITVSPSNDTVCYGQNVTITASPQISGGTYNWSNGANTPAITIVANRDTNYIVNYTVAGCISQDTAIIKINHPTVLITADTSIICSNDSAYICTAGNFVHYNWNNGDSTDCIYVKQAGNYYVTVTDQNNCTVESNHVAIQVKPVTPISISQTGDTLRVYNQLFIQWYLNNQPVPNAHSSVFIAPEFGVYSVTIVDTNGCVVSSSPVIISGIEEKPEDNPLVLYPNPTNKEGWHLLLDEELTNSDISIYDEKGSLIYKSKVLPGETIIPSNALHGLFILQIISRKGTFIRKLEVH